MNFIIELPKSTGFNTVIIVIDLVSRRTYFIFTYIIVTVESTIRLFLHNIWKLHSLSTCIISDRRLQFVVYFAKELYCILDIKVAFSTVQYSQLDEQTECVNQELDQYLYLFVNKRQSDQYNLLSMVDFQYNNYIYATIQQCLLFLDIGYIPRRDFELYKQESRLINIVKFIMQMKSILNKVRSVF